MALFRLIDDKEEFLDAYGKLLALRLLTGVTRLPSTFERNLLSEFKQICGPFYVKSFEKMFADLSEREVSVTVLTGGTWNIRGKLLPGHAALLGANETDFNWPLPLVTEISGKTKNYHQKYPKRKLFWSPLLTSVEFDYLLNSVCVTIRGTCLHLKMLEMISEGSKIDSEFINKTFGQFGGNVLSSLRASGLISDSSDGCFIINQNFKPETRELDLYALTLTDILSTGKNGGIHVTSQSTSSTPLPSKYFASNTPSQQSQISPIDKSILLQCAITRILKQLRVLGLPDLFNRISMLPKLLTRFSPSIKDVLDALKQLHEKEFVKLAFGNEIDDLIDLSDEDLSNIYNENQGKIFIKYLA